MARSGNRRGTRVVRHAVVAATLIAGAWGCALVAGVDFDAARPGMSGEAGAGDAGGGDPDAREQDGCAGGEKCGPGLLCAPSGCVAACPPGLTACGDSCVDSKTSTAHCGACGRACAVEDNADATCADGVCRLACRSGFSRCPEDGGTCAPTPRWYVDDDGDGFGTAAYVEGCERPAGHAPASGDCLDSDPSVHPDAGASTTPFAGSAGRSYDYDCTGFEEEAEGTPAHFPGACSAACSESGTFPLTADRIVPGVNHYCGSPMVRRCTKPSTVCVVQTFDGGVPIACK